MLDPAHTWSGFAGTGGRVRAYARDPIPPRRYIVSLSERIARGPERETRNHPPVNGCTISGPHPCVLSIMPRASIPPVVSPFTRRALARELPAKETSR